MIQENVQNHYAKKSIEFNHLLQFFSTHTTVASLYVPCSGLTLANWVAWIDTINTGKNFNCNVHDFYLIKYYAYTFTHVIWVINTHHSSFAMFFAGASGLFVDSVLRRSGMWWSSSMMGGLVPVVEGKDLTSCSLLDSGSGSWLTAIRRTTS